ncbi:MAG: sodium:calcium antiporter [Acidimicrobiales bacterium]
MIATVALFVGSFALTVASSLVLVEVVDRIGQRFKLSESLVGIATALAADSPEISAAITAIQGGRASLGFGVVIGSNIFNLAALLGLSAVLVGKVRIRPQALALEGVTAMAVTLLISALVLGLLAPVPAFVLVAVVLAPYIGVSALRPDQVGRLPLPDKVRLPLASALASVDKDVRSGQTPPRADRHDLLSVVPALAAVVLGSVGMVDSAVSLGTRWGVPQVLTGTLVLAALTGLPNVTGALRLARRKRGSAVVSEALNSNTLNLLAGVSIPAIIVGISSPSAATQLSVYWLLGITVVTLAFTSRRGGLGRREGAVVIAGYIAFAILLVLGV